MKREGTIGAAGLLAIAAVLGFGLTGGKPDSGGAGGSGANRVERGKSNDAVGPETVCSGLEAHLKEFLKVEALTLPAGCYENGKAPRRETIPVKNASRLRFVVATLPDPLHTRLSFLFDQFTAAIQEGAQDEKYDFDDSWLPWPDGEQTYSSLQDQDVAERRKELIEEQPGIILFRKSVECNESGGPEKETKAGQGNDACGRNQDEDQRLIVFVVGEDATHGMHREQFNNALEWIEQLQPRSEVNEPQVGILGPSFSGSLTSLADLLSEPGVKAKLNLGGNPLPVFSGSVSGKKSSQWFKNRFDPVFAQTRAGQVVADPIRSVTFHSFLQSDDEVLRRFCRFITTEQKDFDSQKFAVFSEDQTAYGKYGGSGTPKPGTSEGDGTQQPKTSSSSCPGDALQLFYPRDISALRGAYQAKGIFDGGSPQDSKNAQGSNLPTDLADPTNPASRIHDSIHKYGGDQTPLSEEAFLLENVAALRELHVRYILLRSSSVLDQLFLTNFLRRTYPNGRVVIMASDLVFPRERGATGLGGTMTLSTYPLFPLARDWTEHKLSPASDRVFSSDTAEGTYIAFRLLLSEKRLNAGVQPADQCHLLRKTASDARIFVPPVVCPVSEPDRDDPSQQEPPIPDYSPPRWIPSVADQPRMADGGLFYPGPATWLSVIGGNQFWPLASLVSDREQHDPNQPVPASSEADALTAKMPGEIPETPAGMKVCLILLAAFSLFHAWCCLAGSYTGKPAFRAYFASTGDKLHWWLVLLGSSCTAFLGLTAGWGCGIFSLSVYRLRFPWFALCLVVIICGLSCAAIYASGITASWLSEGRVKRSVKPCLVFLAALAAFVVLFILPTDTVLSDENRILTYWRSMHLVSGVSPLTPLFSLLIGFYVWVWFALHGLALFGPDRPCLPTKQELAIKDAKGNDAYFFRMFSQEDAAEKLEENAKPLNWRAATGLVPCIIVVLLSWAVAKGVPVRSLGARSYAVLVISWLVFCGALVVGEAWQLYTVWSDLRRLLTFLDRLPLRRTMAALRGFSWGSVWKMSGNVLEVRYKVISRQMESMNHVINSLEEYEKKKASDGDQTPNPPIQDCLVALRAMRGAGADFGQWYSTNYTNPRAGDMTAFGTFQKKVATASGTLLVRLLIPTWRLENKSLILADEASGEKEVPVATPPQAAEEHIRNAEEFVCLTYMGFVQNILGRQRTLAMAMVALFLAATGAVSTYPFDPRQVLSAVLIALFVGVGVVMVKVYAEMHRDATLSHVTNTKPGELGTEFWIKVVGFGLAPLLGLLTRIFPGISDFVFSWLQPGISSLK